ncbi:MAG TPA: phage antirepressor KilAC domain-containing protein, partial [Candidatus Faecalibacterium faecipullorum]|nr:phage antirepressor KilAC domain-containing protein [Candidatus Faecalibacterium faecipullorum]
MAAALGYANTKDALAKHVDPEDKRQDDGVAICDPMGREQHPTIINESGLYSLVLSSKLPTAKKFRHWVTGAKRLFARLREEGYLIRRRGADYNMPTQKAMELGLFEVKETSV